LAGTGQKGGKSDLIKRVPSPLKALANKSKRRGRKGAFFKRGAHLSRGRPFPSSKRNWIGRGKKGGIKL